MADDAVAADQRCRCCRREAEADVRGGQRPRHPVSAGDPRQAVALVFGKQTVIVGAGAPSDTASSVTLDMIGGRRLISQFEPI